MEKANMDFRITEEIFEIVIAFDLEGKILFGNKSAREKLNYSEEELEERNMTEIFWQEFQGENQQFESFDVRKLTEKQETVMYRKNSSCFPVSLRFYFGEDQTGCLFAEDLTWNKDMDVRLRKVKEAEDMNRRLRNEFTANVTHELRTPVNGIRGHVTTLLDGNLDENQRKTLEIILYCCDNMSSIINNILDFSKMESGKFVLNEEEFDFYKLIDQVFATHMTEVNKKELKFSVYVDESIPQFIIGDGLRIGQILNNLLSNAVKFTLMGQISVDISKTMQVNDEIELFFMVKDTGIGISKEQQDTLFESFNQADASITRRFGGTGLGLSITKQLVEMMNGTVHVKSEKGKGSAFSFNIRLHTSQNLNESQDLKEAFAKWNNLMGDMEEDASEDFMEFGSQDNLAEFDKRMEKLILSIELGSWEKAETLAESIKVLLQNGGKEFKNPILRMEMAVRKENYEKSMEACSKIKAALKEKLGEE